MKIRDSDMPDEQVWQSFFDPESILIKLGLSTEINEAVDFGCGFGTFAIAVAKLTQANIYALDIDNEMLEVARKNASSQGLENIHFLQQDFMEKGTGLGSCSIDFAMMFNILHMERPHKLLTEAHRILKQGGKLAVIHWNYDAGTPRGPAMSIRPKPEHIMGWARAAGFSSNESDIIDLPPYHYGLPLSKTENTGCA